VKKPQALGIQIDRKTLLVIRMKQLLLTVVPLLFLEHSCAAVAIVDVDSPWGGTKTFPIPAAYGQTFTPTINGQLVGLRLNVTSSSPFIVTLWDYNSNIGQLGNILGSQSFSTTTVYSGSYGWAEVAFKPGIQQFAGKPLAFTVSSNGSKVPGPATSSRDLYSGGAFFDYAGIPSVNLMPQDLNFQTLVLTVPEPTSAILVLFSFLIGSMRRKNR
jgi:hypothetical protein